MAAQKWATRLVSLSRLNPSSDEYFTKTGEAYVESMSWQTCAVGEACGLTRGQPPPTKTLDSLGHRFARSILRRDFKTAKKLEQEIRAEAAKPYTRDAMARQDLAMSRHVLVQCLYEVGYKPDDVWGAQGKQLGLTDRQCQATVGDTIADMSARQMWDMADRLEAEGNTWPSPPAPAVKVRSA